MEFRFSIPVDPLEVDTQGLCEGIAVRAHRDAVLEDVGIIKVQQDWRASVAPIGFFKGGLNPLHSFVSFAMPECLPERLEIVSYANEFGFLHDDIFEKADLETGDAEITEMREGFLPGAAEKKSSGKRLIQSKMVLKMLTIDRERAQTALSLWAEFLAKGGGRGNDVQYTRMEEYIEYRIEDVGRTTWSGLLLFGCAITIPAHEADACSLLCRPAWVAAALTNDLFSWQKEYDAAVESGHSYVSNAIWVLMTEHKVDVNGAKDRCRQMIRENVAEYVAIVKEARNTRDRYSVDLLRFMDGMQYSVSGNLAWSVGCPRYNADAQFSARQVEWMTNGIPKQVLDDALVKSSTLAEPRPVAARKRQRGHENATDGRPEPKRLMQGLAKVNGVKTSGNTTDRNGHQPTHLDLDHVLFERHLPRLATQVIDGPSKYIQSLPGKGVRSKVVDALNLWFAVPESSIQIIKKAIDLLHQASLMLDDIQDSSSLRRGKPSTHTIFGLPQTVNSSSYKIAEALDEVLKLDDMNCMRIVIEESKDLYIGQSLDLHWTSNLICPSVGEYLRALDNKTGGLIRMLARLLQVTSPLENTPDIDGLVTMLGRAYGLRDDYKNLSSDEYTKTKGFCEDLDEGKYSLPLIHALRSLPEDQCMVLKNILTQRRINGHSSPEHKDLILGLIDRAGGLDYTLQALQRLMDEVDREVEAVEAASGTMNYELRALIEMIRV